MNFEQIKERFRSWPEEAGRIREYTPKTLRFYIARITTASSSISKTALVEKRENGF